MESLTTIMLGLITAQYGITEEAAAELLFETSEDTGELDHTKVKPEALQTLLTKDAERVTSLKGEKVNKTEIYNKAFNDAKTTILPKAEKALAKKHGVELNGMKLEDLVDKIVEVKIASAGIEINDDTIKKHPLYLALERTSNESMDALKTEHADALKEVETKYARKEQLVKVKDAAGSYFDALNPVLSKDATKASNQRKRFLSQFDEGNYQADGERFIMLDAEGNRQEDKHGQPIYLDQHVNTLASAEFDFKVQETKGGAGNKNKPGGGGVNVPTNEEEYNTQILEAKTVAERDAIQAAWDAAN